MGNKKVKNKKTDKKIKQKKSDKIELTIEEQLAIEKDKNLRLFAEFDNFRKRTAKERIELFSTAGQDIMTCLLPILDDLERAITANSYKENDGIVLIEWPDKIIPFIPNQRLEIYLSNGRDYGSREVEVLALGDKWI